MGLLLALAYLPYDSLIPPKGDSLVESLVFYCSILLSNNNRRGEYLAKNVNWWSTFNFRTMQTQIFTQMWDRRFENTLNIEPGGDVPLSSCQLVEQGLDNFTKKFAIAFESWCPLRKKSDNRSPMWWNSNLSQLRSASIKAIHGAKNTLNLHSVHTQPNLDALKVCVYYRVYSLEIKRNLP